MKRYVFALLLPVSVLILSVVFHSRSSYAAPTGSISTTPNFKVAFTGDTGGSGGNFSDVLTLIKNEGAQLVMQQGDMGYEDSASDWAGVVNSVLGPTFPYLMSDGNHEAWTDYEPFVTGRLQQMGISASITNGGNYTGVYNGLKMVFVSEPKVDPTRTINPQFINASFSGDAHIWKVCSWHHNMNDFQAGGKGDEAGWPIYQACQKYGAIVATGHEHSYSRTYTLNGTHSNGNHTVEGFPNVLNLSSGSLGKNFVFVSGMGGREIRDYHTAEHNDDKWWASIYTINRYCKNTCTKPDFSGQDLSRDLTPPNSSSKYGVTFITFHVDGNPCKARGYTKMTTGEIVDEFDIYAESDICNNVTPGAPTNTPIPTTPGATVTIDPTVIPAGAPTNTPTPAYVTITPGGNPLPTATPTITPTPSTTAWGGWDTGGGLASWLYTLFSYTSLVPPGMYSPLGSIPMYSCQTSITNVHVPTKRTIQLGSFECDPIPTPIPSPTPTVIALAPTATQIPTATLVPGAPTNTPTPLAPTATPPEGTVIPAAVGKGIWISTEELAQLPTSGSAWNSLVSAANSSWGSAQLGDNNSNHDVLTLAGALVAARTNDTAMRNKVIQGLQSAMGSSTSRTLELARGLQSYVIAADIIDYQDVSFKAWVKRMLEDTSIPGRRGGGLYENALKDSTNWGGHERASAMAAALYLNDTQKQQELARVYREFLGENVTPKTLTYDPTNWHADPSNKAGVNRKGTTINGTNVSGVLPEDWRRGSEYRWLPTSSGYMWEGMQGFTVTAVLMHRSGYVPITAGDNALVRAMDMLYGRGEASANSPLFLNPAAGDDTWIPWVVNKYTGTTYPTQTASAGKNMGWTDWTHQ